MQNSKQLDGWQMTLANFSELQMIYGEEVLDKIKGYDFI